MRSMTGFGSTEYNDENLRLTVELKAYNNKFLDINLNLPYWLGAFEGRIRDKVKSMGIQRGRVEINLRLKELKEDITLTIDNSMAKEVVSGLKRLIKENGLNKRLTVSDVTAFDGVVKSDKKRDIEKLWVICERECEKVLKQFIIEKEREGESLKKDIFESLDKISSHVEEVKGYIPQVESKIKDNFVSRFQEVMGNDIDETRILSELGVLLVKYDINEEIVRLNSHIENFRLSSKEKPCGKKLDFICQEMNREINTIGSKSPLIEISQIVVNMKNELEQIREQARNVE